MVLWNLVLKKKLLNMVLVGPVNNAQDSGKKASAGKCTKRASQTEAMAITLVFFSRV